MKVVLRGEGADELFAGYNYHRHFHSPWARFAERVRHHVLRKLDPRDRTYSSRLTAYPYAMRPATIEALVSGLPGTSGELATNTLEEEWAGGPANSALGRALHVDTRGWLPDDLLVKLDRMTMAHSLEARVPFLDYRVVELAMHMPPAPSTAVSARPTNAVRRVPSGSQACPRATSAATDTTRSTVSAAARATSAAVHSASRVGGAMPPRLR